MNSTVESRYLAVDGTIFYKFKLLEVQIGLVKKSQTPNYGWKRQSKCTFDSDASNFAEFEISEFEISRVDCSLLIT